MFYLAARRLLAGLAVAGAVVAPATAPAYAAPAAATTIDMYVGDSTVPRGPAGLDLGPDLWASAPIDLHQPSITYQLSDGLAGVTLTGPKGDTHCTKESATKLVCAWDFDLSLSPDATAGPLSAHLRASALRAKIGATGTVTATLAGEGVAPVTRTARVRVAQNVDLATDELFEVSAAPGDDFEAPLVVRNEGVRTIDGVTALFYDDYAFQPRQQYSNCTYSGGRLRSCTFDARIPRGASVDATLEYKLRADTYAPGYEAGEVILLTPDEAEDYRAYLQARGGTWGTPGAGGTLELSPSLAALRRPQSDAHPDNNYGIIDLKVTGKQGADLVAKGAEVKGAAGAEVTATVGVRNNGPATIDWNRSGETIATTDVDVPAGTTVLTVPAGCRQTVDGQVDGDQPAKPGFAHYQCASGYLVKAGETISYAFGLRIDKVVPNATGVVAVNNPCECSIFADDLDLTNNKAAIVVNAAGTPGNGGQGGGGGSLPITGPMGATIAGVGVLLLAAGGVGFAMARRRRTRFVA
ncbi:MAG: hypothetical protein QOE51_4767 [Actinoplanes sp.]|jgi:hypothetical protein|nr:hypothetical protein [Actinoplanes sp.]